jgi:hypothetical protein
MQWVGTTVAETGIRLCGAPGTPNASARGLRQRLWQSRQGCSPVGRWCGVGQWGMPNTGLQADRRSSAVHNYLPTK